MLAGLAAAAREALRARRPPAVELPAGRYYFVLQGLSGTHGGLTASVLARARAFARQSHQPVTILTVKHGVRTRFLTAVFRAEGVLPWSSTILNVHEDYALRHYDDADATVDPPVGAQHTGPGLVPQQRPSRHRRRKQVMVDPDTSRVLREEYLRGDGTAYLRRHLTYPKGGKARTDRVECLDRRGRVREIYPTMAALHRHWVEEVIGAQEPAFLVLDGPPAARDLTPLARPGRHLFYVVHSAHLQPGETYAGALHPQRAHMFTHLDRVDGMVLLTEQQRRDVMLRLGPRTNLFVVPHASSSAPRFPDPRRRDLATVVVVARLSPLKRLDHTVRAFAPVLEQVPQARLEIYGSGPELERLTELAEGLGLTDRVRFHGHEPAASRHFRTATLTVLSSIKEGRPLAMLEAMGAGCPVVSYDFAYGPQDLIEDGHTGLLVPGGDIEALGDAMVRIIRDRSLGEHLSRGSWERSRAFDEAAMVRRWAEVFDASVRLQPRRTSLTEATLDDLDLSLSDGGYAVRARLTVAGTIPTEARADHRLRWLLIARGSKRQLPVTAVVEVADVGASRANFTVSGTLDPEEIVAAYAPEPPAGGPAVLDVRLELVWNNSQQRLRAPAPDGLPSAVAGVAPYRTTAGMLSIKVTSAGR